MRRFLPALILTIIGISLAVILASREAAVVGDHLVGFPDDDKTAHLLRPAVLCALCLVPAFAALYYGLVGSLDRYLIRSFMGAFTLCFTALFSIWLIGDLTENISNFRGSGNTLHFMGMYYGAAFPKFFVDFAPFGLLLAMLYSLGKLSRGQEIVSIIQTGRGVARLIAPLITMGFMVGLVCLGFNYRWAPAAAAYHDALLEEAKMGSLSRARNVVYFTEDNRRLWFIGGFPYDYHQGEPLKNIIVRSFSEKGSPEWRLRAERAEWDRHSNNWTFHGVSKWDLTNRLNTKESPIDPKRDVELPDPYVVEVWSETPWQLIKPGLKAEELGIPGLYSWLVQNRESEWGNKRQFLTQWHYRWAQPGICLAIVLLAAPLGIVFSRRGAAGGIALAIFICSGMMFSSTVFLSLGESGYMPPLWAAWGTNILATAMALVLIQRRLVGRPIYQTLRTLIPA
ncbi:MAG: LptF/LptG family permease [Akkermansiaceae bacterium]|nr:LptF/LptG family permease [Akkermansiaceae bacterium]